MFYKLSPNLVHRGPMARQKPSSNLVTLTLYSRSRRSFKMATYARWLALNIWGNIWRIYTKFCTHKHQDKAKTKMNLTVFSRSQRPFKKISTQYLKIYSTYPHQMWYRKAPVQGEDYFANWVTLTNFQGHEGHLCNTISSQYLKKY